MPNTPEVKAAKSDLIKAWRALRKAERIGEDTRDLQSRVLELSGEYMQAKRKAWKEARENATRHA